MNPAENGTARDAHTLDAATLMHAVAVVEATQRLSAPTPLSLRPGKQKPTIPSSEEALPPPYPTLLEGHHVLYYSSNKVTLLNMVVTCYCYGVLGLNVQMLLYDYMKSFIDKKNMPRMVYSWERRRVVFNRFRSRPPPPPPPPGRVRVLLSFGGVRITLGCNPRQGVHGHY